MSATTGYFSGRVGIGTGTPSTLLEVGGSGRLRVLSGVATGPTTGTGLELSYVSSPETANVVSVDRDSSLFKPFQIAASVVKFLIGTSAVPEAMRIDTSGHVGIGTITPTATLQVSGTFTVSNSASPASPSLYVDGTGRVAVGTTSIGNNRALTVGDITSGANLALVNSIAGKVWQLDALSDRMRLGEVGNEILSIKSGSYVGIANTSPIAKLDVGGTISASDAIQLGSSSLTCAASIAGALRDFLRQRPILQR